MQTNEYHYRILRRLEERPDMSQRELAEELGVSVGKVNYCLRALVDRGLVKVNNFRNSSNKRAYLYLLTRKGFTEKSKSAVRFLGVKIAEYETLREEIEQLKREAKLR